MRPDPRQGPEQDDSGRIIYLGDVRRRRGRRRQAPDHHYLAVLLVVAALGWLAWLGVVLTLTPDKLLTYLAFFFPLSVALAGTGAVASYAVEWQRGLYAEFRTCLRRGVLASALVTINLALLAAHHWTLLAAGVSVVIAAALDAADSYRGRR